jgi:hypothetical protein
MLNTSWVLHSSGNIHKVPYILDLPSPNTVFDKYSEEISEEKRDGFAEV